MSDSVIKICPKCAAEFRLCDVIDDPDVSPIGMQFIGANAATNKYFFNHDCTGCGTTFTVAVTEFTDMIEEPIPDDSLAGSPECKEHCLSLHDLSDCDKDCRYAPFRRFLINVLAKRSREGRMEIPASSSTAYSTVSDPNR